MSVWLAKGGLFQRPTEAQRGRVRQGEDEAAAQCPVHLQGARRPAGMVGGVGRVGVAAQGAQCGKRQHQAR